MTIAVTLKVHDGLILAADSATTLHKTNAGEGLSEIINVYNHANKIFNLYKGRPIGAVTFGAGSIGYASISTLAKDLRKRFMGNDPEAEDWALDVDNYSMEQVANSARRFLYEEMYWPLYQTASYKPTLGFLVAGYSAREDRAEAWLIRIDNGECGDPEQLMDNG